MNLRQDVDSFLEGAKNVLYEAPSDAKLGKRFKLQCIVDALPSKLQQLVLHPDHRNAYEAAKSCSKRRADLGGRHDTTAGSRGC